MALLATRFAGRFGGIGCQGQRRSPLHSAGGASNSHASVRAVLS
jgi:hypothetical protein